MSSKNRWLQKIWGGKSRGRIIALCQNVIREGLSIELAVVTHGSEPCTTWSGRHNRRAKLKLLTKGNSQLLKASEGGLWFDFGQGYFD